MCQDIPADFSEYQDEEAYRAKIREIQKASEEDGEDIEWSDEQERIFRRRYIDMR